MQTSVASTTKRRGSRNVIDERASYAGSRFPALVRSLDVLGLPGIPLLVSQASERGNRAVKQDPYHTQFNLEPFPSHCETLALWQHCRIFFFFLPFPKVPATFERGVEWRRIASKPRAAQRELDASRRVAIALAAERTRVLAHPRAKRTKEARLGLALASIETRSFLLSSVPFFPYPIQSVLERSRRRWTLFARGPSREQNGRGWAN